MSERRQDKKDFFSPFYPYFRSPFPFLRKSDLAKIHHTMSEELTAEYDSAKGGKRKKNGGM